MDHKKKKAAPSHSLAVRILATALAVVVTGGVVTYLVWLILNLFS